MKILISVFLLSSILVAIMAEESEEKAEVSSGTSTEEQVIPAHLVPKKTTKRGAYGYGYGYGFAPYGYGGYYSLGYPYRTYSYSPYRFLYPSYGGYGYYGGYGGYGLGYSGW